MLDTNVLVHSAVGGSPFHQRARDSIRRLHDGGSELWVSRQILREYLAVLSRPQTYSQPQPWPTLAADVQSYEQQFCVAEDGGPVMAELIAIGAGVAVGGKQVHDANIVATMVVNHIPAILTFNVGDFQRFARLVRVDQP